MPWFLRAPLYGRLLAYSPMDEHKHTYVALYAHGSFLSVVIVFIIIIVNKRQEG